MELTDVYRYVIFLNEDRTEMATCWPTVDGLTWKVDRAFRGHPSHTWGPPDRQALTGTLDSITAHFALHGLAVRELVV